MIKGYLKCIFTKGFAIVSEKTDNLLSLWFPYVSFYDDDGKFLFYVPPLDMGQFYRVLRTMEDSNRDSNDHTFFTFDGDGKRYKFIRLVGYLCIAPEEKDVKSYNDCLVVMYSRDALDLTKAINTLA